MSDIRLIPDAKANKANLYGKVYPVTRFRNNE